MEGIKAKYSNRLFRVFNLSKGLMIVYLIVYMILFFLVSDSRSPSDAYESRLSIFLWSSFFMLPFYLPLNYYGLYCWTKAKKEVSHLELKMYYFLGFVTVVGSIYWCILAIILLSDPLNY